MAGGFSIDISKIDEFKNLYLKNLKIIMTVLRKNFICR